MNYRRESGKIRRLTALCAALAVLVVGFGAWAVVGQVRVSRLAARVSELEANASSTGYAGVTAAVNYDPNIVVAEFNGGTVTLGEAMPEYELLISYYEMLGIGTEGYEEEAKMTVLSGMVETKFLQQKAEELGLTTMTDEERAEIEAQAAADYEDNVNYYMAFRTEDGKTDEDARAETIAYLAESGYTLEYVTEEAIQNAWQQRLFDYVTADMAVDDAQLRTFYDEQVETAELTYTVDFSQYEMDVESGRVVVWNPEGVRRVQSILIPFDMDQNVEYLTLYATAEENGTDPGVAMDELYAQLEPDAQRALERLNAGEDFEGLMTEYGTFGPLEGSCISENSVLYGAEFRDAAMALQNVGDTSGIVRTEVGLCILRYAGDVTPGPVPFEQVSEDLRNGYEEELKRSQYNATVVQWLADADARYYTDRF